MCLLGLEGKKFYVNFEDVLEIFYRKFNQIKHNSLEFFFKDGRSMFVNFYAEKRADSFLETF